MPDRSNVDNTAIRVAVLGTGTMGAAMARSLLRSRFGVTVWNRSPDKAKPLFAAGARVASDPAHAVRDADIVLTCSRYPRRVECCSGIPACCSAGHRLDAERYDRLRRDRALAAAAVAHHIPLIDAPVLGTKDPAENATLTVLAAGDAGAITTLQPVFDAIGSRTVIVGDRLGAASDLKLVCNTWVPASRRERRSQSRWPATLGSSRACSSMRSPGWPPTARTYTSRGRRSSKASVPRNSRSTDFSKTCGSPSRPSAPPTRPHTSTRSSTSMRLQATTATVARMSRGSTTRSTTRRSPQLQHAPHWECDSG